MLVVDNPTTLPRIECTASFESWGKLKRDGVEDHDYSCMNIIWYQEEWAFPIVPEAINRIKAVDWDGLADLCWI